MVRPIRPVSCWTRPRNMLSEYYNNTRNTFCRTRSLSNATFSFLITWRSSISKSAAVYKVSSKLDDFSLETWQYNDFQNGGRPPSWNCFTTIRDHLYAVSVAGRSCLSNFMSIWYTYMKIIRIFGLKCLFWATKCGFGELWTPKCHHSSSRPSKGTSLRKSASFKLLTVKIRWGVWPVGELNLTENVTDTHTHTHTHTGKFIFCPCVAKAKQSKAKMCNGRRHVPLCPACANEK